MNWDMDLIKLGMILTFLDVNLIKVMIIIDLRWVERFNAWAEILSLTEVNLCGRQYTWANNLESSTF
jgi:hypothetical protein